MIQKLKYYSIPHLIHIEMSYACNSKCIFCYNPYRGSSINYQVIDKIVQSVYKSQIPHVYLIGGEPSLVKTTKLNEYINLLKTTSSVTIVTNGLIYKKGLSRDLACIGIPIHGDQKTHESLTGVIGGYQKVIQTIKKYVRDGFDVRCIPVLMSVNYNQMYNIIKLAKELGMESVFVDRFESGGIGSNLSQKLKPTLEQFKEALSQMISARDDFKIPVGFGTAIPFCLDDRLITDNMWANCGVGVTFGAINPAGDFRICNQSNIIYGNVLKEPIEKIWNKKKLDEFRGLKWINGPCRDCPFLSICTGGCKVDLICSNKYCVDYAVRDNTDKILSINEMQKLLPVFLDREKKKTQVNIPVKLRNFKLNKYTKLNLWHKEKYLITRYQTIQLYQVEIEIIQQIIKGLNSEEKLIKKFENKIEAEIMRAFISELIEINALDLIN